MDLGAVLDALGSVLDKPLPVVNRSLAGVAADAERQVEGATAAAAAAAVAAATEASGAVTAQVEAAAPAVADARAALDAAEAEVFGRLKEASEWAQAHPNGATAAACGAALLALPPARRLLWRATLGRFTSEEAAFRSAERAFAELKTSAEGSAKEVEKLAERAAAATAQMVEGERKLTAAGRELVSLAARVRAREAQLERLNTDLRAMPSKQALAMRAEVATTKAALARQRAALDRQVGKAQYYVAL